MLGEAPVGINYGEQACFMLLKALVLVLGHDWLKYICLDWKSIASVAMKEGYSNLTKLLKQFELVFKEDLGCGNPLCQTKCLML